MKIYSAYVVCNILDVRIGKLVNEHTTSLGIDIDDYNVVSSDRIDEIIAHMLVLKREAGGASLNTFKALAHDSIKSRLYSVIGDDVYGNYVAQELRKYKLIESHIKKLRGKSTIRYINILDERGGERIPVINLDLSPYVVRNIPKDDVKDSIRSSFVFNLPIFLINTSEYVGFFGELLTEAKKHGTYTIMNLSDPFFARKNRYFVNLSYENGWLDLLVGNRYEFEEFDVNSTRYKIPVIITRDKEGSIIISNGEYHEIPSFDVDNEDVKDTSGDGDYFVAGLIKCLYERNTFDLPVIAESCRYGSYLAAKIIQTVGTDLALESDQYEKKNAR